MIIIEHKRYFQQTIAIQRIFSGKHYTLQMQLSAK